MPRDAFNQVSSTLSENSVGASTKRTQQQDELKQQQTEFSIRINSLNAQAIKIPILVIMVSTPHNAAITDSTIKEDSEDEGMPTIEDEVGSITTEDFSMLIKNVLTITPIPTIINLKSKNRPIKNTSGNHIVQTDMLYLWLSKTLSKRLYPTETSEQKPPNIISNRTKKRKKPRQCEKPRETTNEQNGKTACISL